MSAPGPIGRRESPADPRGSPIAGAGIGLRTCHIHEVLTRRPAVPWFELLADNHLSDGGLVAAHVDAVSSLYPVTLHCVGMNIAGTDPLDPDYLRRVKGLRERTAAAWVSDHLCFTAFHGRQYHDLLPFPYTEEALRHVTDRVLAIQDALGQALVLENVSSYLRFAASPMTEAQFLCELAKATGCGLLLDVNNLFVNHVNHGDDMNAYLQALPLHKVREIHLAGHERGDGYLLDAHNNRVSAEVWQLYERVDRLLPETPALIEWDNDIPALDVLMEEARHAADLARGPGGEHCPAATGT